MMPESATISIKASRSSFFQGKITDIRTVPIIVILILTDKKGHQRTAVIIESIQLMDKKPDFSHIYASLSVVHVAPIPECFLRHTFFFISDTQGNRWRFSGNVQRWFQMDADECTIGDHPVFLIAELAENLCILLSVRAGCSKILSCETVLFSEKTEEVFP